MAKSMSDQIAQPSTVVEPLIAPEWLAGRLDDRDLLILDIRSVVDGGGRDAYEAGHIPAAIHTDYVKDGWRATNGMAAGLLPDRAALGDLLGGLGLAPYRHAVIVSAGTTVGDISAAARVYWTLKAVGHEKTSILAGGMVGWRRDPQRPLEVGAGAARVPRRPIRLGLRQGFAPSSTRSRRRWRIESAVLLDSRATSFFEGRAKSPQVARPGRLPGALQLDHALVFDAGAMALKPKAELARLFAAIPQKPVINYCNPGIKPRPTGSSSPRCSAAIRSRSMTARSRNGPRSPAGPVQTGEIEASAAAKKP